MLQQQHRSPEEQQVTAEVIDQTREAVTETFPRGPESYEDRLAQATKNHKKLKEYLSPEACSLDPGDPFACTETHLVVPARGARAANMDPERLHVIIPGVGTFKDGQIAAAQITANQVGAPVTAIENPTHRLKIGWLGRLGESIGRFGTVRDLIHGAMGLWSAEAGQEAEPNAVNGVMRTVRKAVLEDRMKVALHPYSQGSIITQNALTLLHQESTPDEWRKIAENTTVETSGARIRVWPPDIPVTSNVQRWDIPALGMGLTHMIFHPFERLAPNLTRAVVPGRDHSLKGHAERNAEFFLAAYPEDDVAHYLADSIQEGLLTDTEHHQIIRAALEAGGAKFAREFVKYIDSPAGASHSLGDFELNAELAAEIWDLAAPKKAGIWSRVMSFAARITGGSRAL